MTLTHQTDGHVLLKYSDTIGVDAPTLIAIRYVLLFKAYVHSIINPDNFLMWKKWMKRFSFIFYHVHHVFCL